MIDKKQIEDEEIIDMFQYFLQYFNGYKIDDKGKMSMKTLLQKDYIKVYH